MRYLQKYEGIEDLRKLASKHRVYENIHYLCLRYGIENYTINGDGSIDVDGYVTLWSKKLTELPLKFSNVSGYFSCADNNLSSLVGCPKSVGGYYFSCADNNLSSLVGCPKSVGGNFSCSFNKLTNLDGCTKSVGDSFWCEFNNIDTFEGLDFIRIGGDFKCGGNPIWEVWSLFRDHTKFEFFNDCDPIREDRVIILDRLNFFLDYIDKPTVTRVIGYKCI